MAGKRKRSVTREAKFGVGQVVHHRVHDYRGVIFDVDSTFQGTEEWYEEVAKSRPPRDQPWYHLLVDGETHATYVAERHLEADDSGESIDHPLVERLFGRVENGHYIPLQGVN